MKISPGAFGLVPYKTGYVVVSAQENFRVIKHVNESDNSRLLGVVYIDTVNNQTSDLPGIFTTNLNNGPVFFYKGGQSAVLTRNIGPVTKKSKNKLGLYFLSANENAWSQADFNFNSNAYSCAQAWINEKGDRMIFVSDMPGGYGGTDLYMTTLENGNWTKPKNLGGQINTISNEMFPFVAATGKLFFASNRQGGKGGLDIYQSECVDFVFHQPLLLDTLVNSPGDDFAYWCTPNERNGYFSSSRSGKDRIYQFNFTYPEFKDCESSEERILCYEFAEEATTDVAGTPLKYEWDFGDGHKIKKMSAEHCYEKPGMYRVSLNILDTIINKLYMNEASYDLEVRDIRQPSMLLPDTLKVFDTLHLNTGVGTFTDFSIMHNYWIVENKILEEEPVFYAFKSPGVYKVTLGITSGVDAKGNFNKKCFEKEIVVTSGNETNKLIVKNETPLHEAKKTVKDTSVNYKVVLDESPTRKEINEENFSYLHSRVKEYYLSGDSLYKYTIGGSANPVRLKTLYDSVHKAGFSEARVEGIDKSLKSTSQYEVSDEKLKAISANQLDALAGKTFELTVITFDYNKTEIKPEGFPYLDTLVEYLSQHPTFTLEITAHTDNKGPDEFNKNLSQQRAVSVFDYLSAKGINAKRMIKYGHGEKFPKYPNTTEENMMKNRRVEFRIVR